MGLTLCAVTDEGRRRGEADDYLRIPWRWQQAFPTPETDVEGPSSTESEGILQEIRHTQDRTKATQLSHFWTWVVDAESARECAEDLRRFYPNDESGLLEAAYWLESWADRGARFELS